jgi:hypothetical protein
MRKVYRGALHQGLSAFDVGAMEHLVPRWITKVTNDQPYSIGEKR